MSPRKQPSSLFRLCIKKTLGLINECCYDIEKSYSDIEYNKCKKRIYELKSFLLATLPARVFDVLCLERRCSRYRGDPRVQLHVLIHPRMSIFRRCDIDNAITQKFWVKTIPWFSRLIVLDLKFLCTDEMLEVIATHCLILEELNIVSRVDVCKSLINASVLIRNVSDVGLCCITNLKRLRKLAMDPPRNEKASRVGRCVTQAGLIMLLCELPCLEELNIESCDIGSTLIGTDVPLGPLSLRKVNCHYASAEGIRKLIRLCPQLRELSITHLSANDKELILSEITESDLRLTTLIVSFFSYTESLQRLLQVQGSYLTNFSFWDIDQSINIESVLTIGLYCPNIACLCVMTQSNYLVIPPFFTRPDNIFRQLKSLTLGNENFDLESIMTLFLSCTDRLQTLILKHQVKLVYNDVILRAIQRGFFKKLCYLWLDITLEVSKEVLMHLMHTCDLLTNLTADFSENLAEIMDYININNFDVRLGGY